MAKKKRDPFLLDDVKCFCHREHNQIKRLDILMSTLLLCRKNTLGKALLI